VPQKSVEMPSTAKLDDAYEELTRAAFAVWLRMSADSTVVLQHSGVHNLAKRYGYARRGFFEVLRQLRNKGYVRYNTPPRGESISVTIARRPLLVGVDQFVKLS